MNAIVSSAHDNDADNQGRFVDSPTLTGLDEMLQKPLQVPEIALQTSKEIYVHEIPTVSRR